MVAAAATSVVSHQERTITGYGAASAGKQCAASLIDVCCVALGTVVAMVLSRNPAVCVMIAVEMVLVFAVWEAVRGETPGKVVLGVRTVRVECQRDHRNGILPAGLSRAFVKYLVLLASSMVFGIGLLIMICSPMFSRSELRQGWADKIARLAEADIHKQVTAALPVQKLQFHTVSSSTMHESTTSGSALSVPAPEPAPAPVIPKTPVSPAVPSVPLSAPAPALAPDPRCSAGSCRFYAFRAFCAHGKIHAAPRGTTIREEGKTYCIAQSGWECLTFTPRQRAACTSQANHHLLRRRFPRTTGHSFQCGAWT